MYIIPKEGMLVRTRLGFVSLYGIVDPETILFVTKVTEESIPMLLNMSSKGEQIPPNYIVTFLHETSLLEVTMENTATTCTFAEHFEVLRQ